MITIPMTVSAQEAEISMAVSVQDINVPMTLSASYNPISGSSLPEGGHYGDLLAKRTDADYDVEWITPANNAEQDNTRPITAAAVYTEIGNINALLATI